jgi:hypothetical protein
MALDYHLKLETEQNSEDLFRLLIEQCGFKRVSEEVVENNEVTAGVSRREILPPGEISFGQAIWQKAYGFVAKTTVWFRYRGASRDEAKKPYSIVIVLQSAITLLENLPEGNAVLESFSDTTVLWRMDGQLEIDSKWNEGLSLEDLPPHNVRSLPSPLL